MGVGGGGDSLYARQDYIIVGLTWGQIKFLQHFSRVSLFDEESFCLYKLFFYFYPLFENIKD